MNEIYGKRCPYCKSELKHGQDIIVCSECNMPHHKECWVENEGCTTFGCFGTIDTPSQKDNNDFELTLDDFDMVQCDKCGLPSPCNDRYCSHCGCRLYSERGVGFKSKIKLGNGLDSDYYAGVFAKMQFENEWFQWNWGSFLLSYYWLIYKRIYLYGMLAFAVSLTFALLNIPIYLIATLLLHFALGGIGNLLYYKFKCKQQGSGKNINKDNEGNNITATVCLAVVFAMIVAVRIQ